MDIKKEAIQIEKAIENELQSSPNSDHTSNALEETPLIKSQKTPAGPELNHWPQFDYRRNSLKPQDAEKLNTFTQNFEFLAPLGQR